MLQFGLPLKRQIIGQVLLVFTSLLFLSCGKAGSGGAQQSQEPISIVHPPVGKVSDKAGFFLDILTTPPSQSNKFNIHKGLSTFDDACIGELGKVVDCYLDAEEQSLFALPVSLHYHVPTTMCAYVSIEPFYFVNRQTKRTTSLTKYTDKNGLIGIDSDKDGTVDSTDFGCYGNDGVPICCVGEYPETSFIWDVAQGAYGSPSTKAVKRTIEQCLGGPATETQTKDPFGVPIPTLKFVEGRGLSDVYKLSVPKDHQVGPGWLANYFDSSQHAGGLPTAFSEDIDPGAKEEKYGNPYYKITCLDSGGEALASIRLQIREWNTASDFAARRVYPNKYDENGGEPDPWSGGDKNDFKDWLDFELGGSTHPGFEYKKTEPSAG